MCYFNRVMWDKCGHFCVVHEMCATARQRQPPSWCEAAHMPIMTHLLEDSGNCPDLDKHPLPPGESAQNGVGNPWGITETTGPGNEAYQRSNDNRSQGRR